MSYLALNSWLEGEDVWRCTCSEISHGIFLPVFAMEGLSITKFQLVSQHNCILYFCSCKDINQKGLKQVQRFQTDTQNALLVKERTELVSLCHFLYKRQCYFLEIMETSGCGLVR